MRAPTTNPASTTEAPLQTTAPRPRAPLFRCSACVRVVLRVEAALVLRRSSRSSERIPAEVNVDRCSAARRVVWRGLFLPRVVPRAANRVPFADKARVGEDGGEGEDTRGALKKWTSSFDGRKFWREKAFKLKVRGRSAIRCGKRASLCLIGGGAVRRGCARVCCVDSARFAHDFDSGTDEIGRKTLKLNWAVARP